MAKQNNLLDGLMDVLGENSGDIVENVLEGLLENSDDLLQNLADTVSGLTGLGAENVKASAAARKTGKQKSSVSAKKTASKKKG